MTARIAALPLALSGLMVVASCTTPTAQPVAVAPQFVELDSSPSVATVHFPPGVYTLNSADAAGYYYQAPRKVMKHEFGGAQPYDGGLFVSRSDRNALRGYIIWAGGRTKIGNLSSEPHHFRD